MKKKEEKTPKIQVSTELILSRPPCFILFLFYCSLLLVLFFNKGRKTTAADLVVVAGVGHGRQGLLGLVGGLLGRGGLALRLGQLAHQALQLLAQATALVGRGGQLLLGLDRALRLARRLDLELRLFLHARMRRRRRRRRRRRTDQPTDDHQIEA